MDFLTLIVAAKLSTMPLATGLYRFEWKRAWVDNGPAERAQVVEPKALRRWS